MVNKRDYEIAEIARDAAYTAAYDSAMPMLNNHEMTNELAAMAASEAYTNALMGLEYLVGAMKSYDDDSSAMIASGNMSLEEFTVVEAARAAYSTFYDKMLRMTLADLVENGFMAHNADDDVYTLTEEGNIMAKMISDSNRTA